MPLPVRFRGRFVAVYVLVSLSHNRLSVSFNVPDSESLVCGKPPGAAQDAVHDLTVLSSKDALSRKVSCTIPYTNPLCSASLPYCTTRSRSPVSTGFERHVQHCAAVPTLRIAMWIMVRSYRTPRTISVSARREGIVCKNRRTTYRLAARVLERVSVSAPMPSPFPFFSSP